MFKTCYFHYFRMVYYGNMWFHPELHGIFMYGVTPLGDIVLMQYHAIWSRYGDIVPYMIRGTQKGSILGYPSIENHV